MRVGVTFDQRKVVPYIEQIADIVLTNTPIIHHLKEGRAELLARAWELFSHYLDLAYSNFVGGVNVGCLLDEHFFGEDIPPDLRQRVVDEVAERLQKAQGLVDLAMRQAVSRLSEYQEELYEVVIHPAAHHQRNTTALMVAEGIPDD